ncbi:endolytic transglycosylase MltG [Humidesulfovibrio sp.]
MKRVLWFFTGFAAALAVVMAAAAFYVLSPAQSPGREAIVLIRPGMALPAIARELESQGLIRNAQAFVLLAKLQHALPSAKAGEFQLSSGWTPQEILRVITTTSGLQHKVVVREGLPWWGAAKLFAAQGLADQDDFAKAMQNATLLQKYSIPGPSAEGFLFPETYQLPRAQADNAHTVVEAMLKEFERQAKKLWPQGPPPAEELLRVVTLASLVERETGDASERPRIAGVFANRLKLGMRLQCDPTTIYGLGPDFGGDLKRVHLEDAQNRYNTYAHAGLPPGPICSPGLEALKAALNPEAHEYIFFVARGDGTHEFSVTLDEHNRAVNRYQRRRDPDTYQSAPQPRVQVPQAASPAKGQPHPAQPKSPGPKPGKQQKPAPAKPAAQKPQTPAGQTAKGQAPKNGAAKAAKPQTKAESADPAKPQAKGS